MSGSFPKSFSSGGVTVRLGDHDLLSQVAKNPERVCSSINSLRPAIEAAFDFVAQAEKQSAHSFDVNISLTKDEPKVTKAARQEGILGLLCIRLNFIGPPNEGKRQKRAVNIELRSLIDDSYIGTVEMPLNRYVVEPS